MNELEIIRKRMNELAVENEKLKERNIRITNAGNKISLLMLSGSTSEMKKALNEWKESIKE